MARLGFKFNSSSQAPDALVLANSELELDEDVLMPTVEHASPVDAMVHYSNAVAEPASCSGGIEKLFSELAGAAFGPEDPVKLTSIEPVGNAAGPSNQVPQPQAISVESDIKIKELEDVNAQQKRQLETRRLGNTELEHQLKKRDSEVQFLSENRDLLRTHLVQLDTKIAETQQAFQEADKKSQALETQLGYLVQSRSQLSQQLLMREQALASTEARLNKIEAASAAGELERAKIASALNDATAAHAREIMARDELCEELRNCIRANEGLINEAHNLLQARSDELLDADSKLSDEALARTAIEIKLSTVEAERGKMDHQIESLKQELQESSQHVQELLEEIATHQAAFSLADDQRKHQVELVTFLENQLNEARESLLSQAAQFQVQLQQQQTERLQVENEINVLRNEIARLLPQLAMRQFVPMPTTQGARGLDTARREIR